MEIYTVILHSFTFPLLGFMRHVPCTAICRKRVLFYGSQGHEGPLWASDQLCSAPGPSPRQTTSRQYIHNIHSLEYSENDQG